MAKSSFTFLSVCGAVTFVGQNHLQTSFVTNYFFQDVHILQCFRYHIRRSLGCSWPEWKIPRNDRIGIRDLRKSTCAKNCSTLIATLCAPRFMNYDLSSSPQKWGCQNSSFRQVDKQWYLGCRDIRKWRELWVVLTYFKIYSRDILITAAAVMTHDVISSWLFWMGNLSSPSLWLSKQDPTGLSAMITNTSL